MFAFILESLGATELIFILAIALIFFGPRKLPQLARSMGKGLAEFRKASDDFKRTWEREVALEGGPPPDQAILDSDEPREGENINAENADTSMTADPQLEPANPEWAVPREDSPYATAEAVEATAESSPEPVPVPAETAKPEPLRKHDWL
ncbi:MAG TPA: twin-arginine translocase TatA/TatE family subunit [Pyrinomonadaceae bacterium]|nr:twin-arginine translocase TatA/TatE family subunit [Pyrinomonadaceae bacterium]